MGIALEIMGLKTAHIHDVQNVFMVVRPVYYAVLTRRLAYYFADGKSGGKAGVGVLEYHLQVGTYCVELPV